MTMRFRTREEEFLGPILGSLPRAGADSSRLCLNLHYSLLTPTYSLRERFSLSSRLTLSVPNSHSLAEKPRETSFFFPL